MKIKVIFLVIFIGAIWLYLSKNKTYEEGVWNTITYSGVNRDEEKATTKINVTHSQAIQLDDRTRLIVFFKVKNIEKYPLSFGWENKYVNMHGLSFMPTRGDNSENVQPYSESDELSVEYKLPAYTDLTDIEWGLYDSTSHSFRYKIKLKPVKKNIQIQEQPKLVTYETLLKNTENLIGMDVIIQCKKFPDIQLNNFDNKKYSFYAPCKNIDDQFPISNFDILFTINKNNTDSIKSIPLNQKFSIYGKVDWAKFGRMELVTIHVNSIE